MSDPARLGPTALRDVLCAEYHGTHVAYQARDLDWPSLGAVDLALLRSLPVWDEALTTERRTAGIVQAYARQEPDPVLRAAVALQGLEEARHAALLDDMVRVYGLPAPPPREEPLPSDLEWAFLRVGFGECLDSFFAFGLFALAKDSGLFPAPLVELFDPVLQEEARHILFFANWVALARARRSRAGRALHSARCAGAFAAQVVARVRGVFGLGQDHFTRSHESFAKDITAARFLDACLAEDERRLAPYDARLLRPRLVPAIVRRVRGLLGANALQLRPREAARHVAPRLRPATAAR